MRKRLQNERRVKFAFEGSRFWDVRRWLIAKTVDDVAVLYKPVVIQTRVFADKHYLMPIPQNEIDKDPNLVQNYGS